MWPDEDEDEDEDEKPKTKTVQETVWDWDLLNENKALWLRNPTDVTEEEHEKFFQALSKVFLALVPQHCIQWHVNFLCVNILECLWSETFGDADSTVLERERAVVDLSCTPLLSCLLFCTSNIRGLTDPCFLEGYNGEADICSRGSLWCRKPK